MSDLNDSNFLDRLKKKLIVGFCSFAKASKKEINNEEFLTPDTRLIIRNERRLVQVLAKLRGAIVQKLEKTVFT
jgi:hypothetical protein